MAPVTHPARKALDEFTRAHPGIWQLVDKARAEQPRKWPAQVFLPQTRAHAILGKASFEYDEKPERKLGHTRMLLSIRAAAMTVFAAWRTTQGIYRFDPDIYAALQATPVTGAIPVETLSRLPEWCVYIETPGVIWRDDEGPVVQNGLWACLDWHETVRTPLSLLFGLNTDRFIQFAHIPLVGTLEQSLIQIEEHHNGGPLAGPVAGTMSAPAVREKARRIAQDLSPFLSLVLYLCSEAPELGDGTHAPQKPEPRMIKGKARIFSAEAPVAWSVGVRMGAALRQAREREASQTAGDQAGDQAEGRRTVRPHVRRAHWAHRWTGPMTGERKSLLRWIHPVLVNAGSPDDLPSVIRPVKGEPTEQG